MFRRTPNSSFYTNQLNCNDTSPCIFALGDQGGVDKQGHAGGLLPVPVQQVQDVLPALAAAGL